VRGHLAAALILPLYYLADATITLVWRVLDGEKPWEAHRRHFYQRSGRVLGSHSAVVSRIAACNVALVLAALLSLRNEMQGIALAVAAVGVLLGHLELIARRGATPQAKQA
jgi:UDP-N-acetylmuramyl pentapeptide phosphotransferase/UDP-N-acetylglucosamine-1-phosphate transferase